MTPAGGGWWRSERPHRGRYRFVVDGDARVDPRSPALPDGIDGWSETVDHDAFAWTDDRWTGFPLAAAVLMELHVGTFSPAGTFDGVVEHLDSLVDLGVNAIEVMPVATFGGRRGWGYDGVGLFAPHPAYGGPAGFKRLVDACHAKGIAVVLDVVYNHLGPAGNHLARFGPYFTDRYHTPWGDAVNLDGQDAGEVRRFFVDNALSWVRDHHVDGLRLDAVHAFMDRSAITFLEQLADEVHRAARQLGREVWVIAESDLNDPRLVRPPEAGGYGLDAAWSDDFHHALHTVLTGERTGYYADYGSLEQLAKAIEHVYVVDGCWSPSRGRVHGRPVGDLPRHRFLGYAQNHDQIGNRAMGDRLSMSLPPGRLHIAAALVLLAPFVPMLFQGEEWGATTPFLYFTDHADPDLGEAVRQGRRREFAAFGWDPESIPDPQADETFRRSVLDRGELASPRHADLRAWHQRLIAVRRSRVAPDDGARARTGGDEAGWLVVDRGSVAVAVNVGQASATVPLPWRPAEVFGPDGPVPVPVDDDPPAVTLGPDQVVVALAGADRPTP
jgi:maltooligosyltrehalose trehalohydrolase